MEIDTESIFNKAPEPSFYVAPSLYDKHVNYVFRCIGGDVYQEIKVSVVNGNFKCSKRLSPDEIEYFDKHIV